MAIVRLNPSVVTIDQDILAFARHGLGLKGDTEARLRRMLKQSALITHPHGNRRYLDFLFDVREGRLCAVHRIDLTNEAPNQGSETCTTQQSA